MLAAKLMHLGHSFLNRIASNSHHHAEEQPAPDEMVSPLHAESGW